MFEEPDFRPANPKGITETEHLAYLLTRPEYKACWQRIYDELRTPNITSYGDKARWDCEKRKYAQPKRRYSRRLSHEEASRASYIRACKEMHIRRIYDRDRATCHVCQEIFNGKLDAPFHKERSPMNRFAHPACWNLWLENNHPNMLGEYRMPLPGGQA